MRDQVPALLGNGGSNDFESDRWRIVRPNMDKERCTNCGACVYNCPMGTVYADGTIIRIRYDGCIGCGICAVDCPIHAITMEPTVEPNN